MKNRFTNIITLTLILVIVAVFVLPNHAFAQATLLKYAGFPSPMDLLNSFLAYIVNAAVGIAGFLVTAAAYVLDTSIILTLHIRDFVDATPAIYTVWKTIRDITGLFFIFYLLYAAIQMILGQGSGSYGKTITNIVIAGILVNFSFFIVGIGIDASNVISQAIYNAMIPNQAKVTIAGTPLAKLVEQNPGKAKISNIFMNSLKIQTMYDTQGNKVGVAVSDPFKIILIGVAGVIMMITTAASFLLAAVAFIARLVILLFLLAFSPVLFLGSVLPELKTYTTQFTSTLKSQLTFMPAYLLLMYVALKILNESDLMGGANLMATGAPTGTNWALPYIVLGVNFTLVIIMLNLPLIAGLSMGGMATKVLGDKMGKWNAKNVWGNVGGWAKNRATTVATGATVGTWTNTGSRVASRIATNKTFQNLAGKSWLGEKALVGTRAVAKNYNEQLETRTKKREDFAKTLDRKAAATYAERLSSSVPSRLSVFHTIGRADRVGAAKILNTRLTEVTADANRLTGELNQITNAAIQAGGGLVAGLPTLPLYQQQRYDQLTGQDRTGINPPKLDPVTGTVISPNEIVDAQRDLGNIRTQIQAFQTQTGASVRDTTKRNY